VASFSGKITTTGKSEAIRLEKALFRAHPEFRQKATVRASVIAPGQLLVSVCEEEPAGAALADDDPLVGAFVRFLADDIRRRPDRVVPLSTSCIEHAVKLTAEVEVEDDEPIPDDVGL
jgi:antitoxin PrlF